MVVDDGVAFAVELLGQQLFSQRKAHRVGDALAQRAGGGFHAGGDAVLGVTSGFAVQLAEVLQLFDGQVVAAQVQHRIQQHRCVTVGEHEAVAVSPVRVGRVVLEVTSPHGHGHVGHAHRRTGVAGIGLLNGIHCECADRIRHLL
ncbi:hypothetical protein SDC9_103421 [bioreactor metagenome]|uniref:Uncharacterized protein n=1 Tax=bioreactor metagenome TaxID=1076179 RepID=A0A645ATM7_9ZZZZ